VIQFYLKFDCHRERTSSLSEPVLLRFSTDGGVHWTLIGRYDALSFTQAAGYVVAGVPYAAKTNSTRLHWWQPMTDNSHRLDWAVDQVSSLASS